MTMILSTGAGNADLDSGLGTMFDGGSDVLEIRSGSRPADADTAPTGSVLCSITIPSDSFGAAASRAIAKAGTWSGTGAAAAGTGTNATWWRMRKSGDAGTTNTTDKRMDGDCGTAPTTTAISGVARTGGMYRITSTAHGLTDGQDVVIAGHSLSSVNGRWKVYNAAANTLDIAFDPGSTGSGGTVRRGYDLELDNVNIAQNQAVSVTGFTISRRASI